MQSVHWGRGRLLQSRFLWKAKPGDFSATSQRPLFAKFGHKKKRKSRSHRNVSEGTFENFPSLLVSLSFFFFSLRSATCPHWAYLPVLRPAWWLAQCTALGVGQVCSVACHCVWSVMLRYLYSHNGLHQSAFLQPSQSLLEEEAHIRAKGGIGARK